MKVDLPEDYRPSEDEPSVNPKQPEYFSQKLLFWCEHLLEESVRISDQLKEKSLREHFRQITDNCVTSHKQILGSKCSSNSLRLA